jgi:hypothetical protein
VFNNNNNNIIIIIIGFAPPFITKWARAFVCVTRRQKNIGPVSKHWADSLEQSVKKMKSLSIYMLAVLNDVASLCRYTFR